LLLLLSCIFNFDEICYQQYEGKGLHSYRAILNMRKLYEVGQKLVKEDVSKSAVTAT